ncbi:MAG: hypothetical protein KGJ73_07560 [Rhodospirillales bacterium]|nr:hypothetical protein [Rhodospirillales bacterium]
MLREISLPENFYAKSGLVLNRAAVINPHLFVSITGQVDLNHHPLLIRQPKRIPRHYLLQIGIMNLIHVE